MNHFLLVALVMRLDELRERREAGQGTLEYVGMIAVAALLIGVVVTAFGDGGTIGEKVTGAIDTVLEIGGGGGG